MKRFYSFLTGLLFVAISASAGNENWITTLNLNDNLYISQLSLPGAHDAATGTLSSSGKCQTLSLTGLWDAGVRVFDLRPTDASGCPIYHGAGLTGSNTGITLTDALNDITGKLNTYPREFAIILMRNENDKGSTDNWKSRVGAILNNFSSYVIPFSLNLRLQDVRGKVIVLSRDEIANGYNLGAWADLTTRDVVSANGDGAFKFVVQDYYQVSNTTTKQNAIKALLAEARTQTSPNFIFVNHTSGYTGSFGVISAINSNAQSSNKCALDNINANSGRTGIIMMDHAGTNNNSYYGLDLCNAIITQNSLLAGLNLATLPDNTDYFLQNVETGLWLQGNTAKTTTSRDGWNTAANMGTYGRPIRIQSYGADGYTLNTQSGPNALGCNYGDASLLYLDGSIGPTRWKLTGTRDAAHITINWDRWLSVDANNRLVNSNAASTWKIWTRAERIAAMASATPQAPQDVTWLMVNPELMNNDKITPQWTEGRSGGNQGWSDGFRPNRVYEAWSFSSLDFYQTVNNVPNGIYEVRAHAMYSPTGGNSTSLSDYNNYVTNGQSTVKAVLYANGEQVKLPSIYSFTSTSSMADHTSRDLGSGVCIVDGWWQIARAMGEDDEFYTEPLRVVVDNRTLRIGVKSISGNPSSNWVVIGSFDLHYLGQVPDVTISENETTAPAIYDVPINVTLGRTLSADHWNTFCSPIDIDAAAIASAFGADTKVTEFDTDQPVADNTLAFKAATAIEAGKPYLIKPAQTTSNPTFNRVSIGATTGTTVSNGDFNFIGVIAGGTSVAANAPDASALNFILNTSDKLVQPSATGNLKGMRAYFNVPSSVLSTSGGQVKLFIDGIEDSPDGIEGLEQTPSVADHPVFNLAGQRVTSAQKGIYILGGKKVLVK